jgi:predicted transcriptional regulator
MSVTKTFRFPDEIDRRLRRAAQNLARKPNAIMLAALQEYLDRLERRDLQSEARRQSLLVSRGRRRDMFWERAADKSGWK